MIIYLSLLVAVIGALMFALCGLLAFLFGTASGHITVLH